MKFSFFPSPMRSIAHATKKRIRTSCVLDHLSCKLIHLQYLPIKEENDKRIQKTSVVSMKRNELQWEQDTLRRILTYLNEWMKIDKNQRKGLE